MKRARLGVGLAAAVASAGLVLATGPGAVMGSAAAAATTESSPAQCAPTARTEGAEKATQASASHGGMEGMQGMDESAPAHSTQELKKQLANTPSGGTLTVQPGVYKGSLVIDRPVTLVGVGHPVIRGDGTGTVLTIRAAGTTVRDLMIEGSGPGPVGNPAGINVQADRAIVKNVHIQDTYTGIWVDGVKDAHLIGNTIEGRKTVAASGQSARKGTDMSGAMDHDTSDKGDMAGMVMGADKGAAQAGRGDAVSLFNAIRPVVRGNTIADVRDGVYFQYGSDTRIECNSVVGGRYAVHSMYGKRVNVAGNHFATNQSGPVLMYGGPVTLEENVISDEQSAATGFGVLLLDVRGARLLRNIFVSNRVGVQIEGPMDDPQPTAVEHNTIALNQVGIGLYPTADAVLSRNSIVENTVQVLGLGADGAGGDSSWSRGGVGNYWSNYRGYTRSERGVEAIGVGAIPHVEGAAAGRLLAANPTLLAFASSPSFTLLRAVEQRSASQRPVVVDQFPIVDPRSPSLPPQTTHAALGTGLVGALSLLICSLVLVRTTKRRTLPSERKTP